MRRERSVSGEHRLIAMVMIAAMTCVLAGCAGLHSKDDASDTKPAYLSRFSTLGSDLRAAPGGGTIRPSDTGIDLVDDIQTKMTKMTPPGFATIR